MPTIRESVQEELVFIGTAGKHLRFAIGKAIKQPAKFYGGAEKAAVECGRSLEVSWAPTSTPEAHKAALVLVYEEQCGKRPGFKRPDTNEWILGVVKLTRKHGEAYSDLVWSPWMPMNDSTISRIPEELGVYRIRSVPAGSVVPVVPAAQNSGSEPHQQEQQEQVEYGSKGKTATLKEFIRKVPAWRAKYLESNMSTFRVEAFIQRDWGSLYLSDPLYEDRYQKVNALIKELTGKEDVERLEDDMEVVYRWGGGHGPKLFSQIINSKNNPIDTVRERMRDAFSALRDGAPVEALEQLKSLKWCSDAFGSKVLAMRSPWNAPIWDNIAQHCLREFTIGGKKVRSYAQFIAFCNHVADELKRLGKPAPRGERWYLRDIEMALFQFGWDNGKFNGRITGELP